MTRLATRLQAVAAHSPWLPRPPEPSLQPRTTATNRTATITFTTATVVATITAATATVAARGKRATSTLYSGQSTPNTKANDIAEESLNTPAHIAPQRDVAPRLLRATSLRS